MIINIFIVLLIIHTRLVFYCWSTYLAQDIFFTSLCCHCSEVRVCIFGVRPGTHQLVSGIELMALYAKQALYHWIHIWDWITDFYHKMQYSFTYSKKMSSIRFIMKTTQVLKRSKMTLSCSLNANIIVKGTKYISLIWSWKWQHCKFILKEVIPVAQ